MYGFVKTAGGYVNYRELARLLEDFGEIRYIYVPGGEGAPDGFDIFAEAEIISDKSVFFDKTHESFSALIKEAFNPLQKTQNTLFITRERRIAFEAPALYEKAVNNGELKRLSEIAENPELLEYLVCYTVTKDLRFMNKLTEFEFDPRAFKLCGELIEGGESGKAEELAAFLSAEGYSCKTVKASARSLSEGRLRAAEAVKGGLRKNVIFMHLESISRFTFDANRHLMPDIAEFFSKAVNFSRFYSSATSTVMAVSAIFRGNDFELDKFTCYEEIMLNSPYSENIFKILRDNGYETRPFIYTNPLLSKEICGAKIYDDGVSKDGRIFDFYEFLSEIEGFIEKNKNRRFAAFIDYEPTHCGVNDSETSEIPLFGQKTKTACVRLNEVFRRVWESVLKNGAQNETVFVLYGDHGDDKWTRCMNNGFSHMTEPYPSSIHTPLAIYDSRLSRMNMDCIISGIDVKPTVLYLLGVHNPDTFPHSGINIFQRDNECVYSASMFANQSETEKIASFEMAKLNGFSDTEIKNKSFCAVNDGFCLIAGNCGMQLFDTLQDPLGYNNLLNFYIFDENGNAARFDNRGAWRGHFRLEIMADSQIYECLKNFCSLKKLLKKRIDEKNACVGNIKNPFNKEVFNIVRSRGFLER